MTTTETIVNKEFNMTKNTSNIKFDNTSNNSNYMLEFLREECQKCTSFIDYFNLSKVMMFMRDKINKFSDITKMTSVGGDYYHLFTTNRPEIKFMEGTDLEDLKKELLDWKEQLDYITGLGVYGDHFAFWMYKKDKEYKKKYMPNLNMIIMGRRNAPSLREMINVLGEHEIKNRIESALEKIK